METDSDEQSKNADKVDVVDVDQQEVRGTGGASNSKGPCPGKTDYDNLQGKAGARRTRPCKFGDDVRGKAGERSNAGSRSAIPNRVNKRGSRERGPGSRLGQGLSQGLTGGPGQSPRCQPSSQPPFFLF